MDRPDISRLNKNRNIYLQLGFIIALSLTVMAFNYTVYETVQEAYTPEPIEEEEFVEVIRTVQKKKPIPQPPVFKLTENIVEPEVIEPEPAPIDPVVVIDVEPSKPILRPTIVPQPKAPVIVEVEPEEKIPPIFDIVEQMPRFAGCEDQGLNDADMKSCSDGKLLNFINKNIKYPPLARENGIEGTVVASFVVEKDGSISELKIIREIGGGCGREVTRIIEKMPEWIAGQQQGRKVRVRFNLPVKFSLQ